MVRWVITGISRAAPSSVAFSTSQSVCARLTGANASQTSGMVSASRGLPLDVQRHPLLAGLGDAREPFARRSVEHQQLGALAEPEDVAEIIGLVAVELDRRAGAERLRDEQARQALGRPGGGCGHGRGLPSRHRPRQRR